MKTGKVFVLLNRKAGSHFKLIKNFQRLFEIIKVKKKIGVFCLCIEDKHMAIVKSYTK